MTFKGGQGRTVDDVQQAGRGCGFAILLFVVGVALAVVLL